ncbi:hypothetical protein KBK19_15685 [Microvirga sp. STR05]|uniref:Uncharacterized protein n=1 Tax=Hymenobacter duratus TaxID=2771356 RepID=A0ABR8JI06_9BACT|nr:hypothetical protein [Hymenobacter duratus]MBD2716483.1 hypothetical protein [Hymenobacter duratus]MBR7951398.1 hypothetical protein [Microvirga sp. STR05]
MTTPVASPFALGRTFVFRRYLTLRRHIAAPAADLAAKAARRARKLRKKEAKDERLRNFFGWCAGCEAYGSIF